MITNKETKDAMVEETKKAIEKAKMKKGIITRKELEKWSKKDLIDLALLRNSDAKDYAKYITKLQNIFYVNSKKVWKIEKEINKIAKRYLK